VKLQSVWAVNGSKPIILTTGSHRKIVVSGAVAEDGSQLFRLYDSANSDAFLDFLNALLRKYAFVILFIDKAPWHKEKRVIQFFRKNKHRLKIRWFPSGFPEANPMEECWNQGKSQVLGSIFYDSFADFQNAVSIFYRTKRFMLDLYKYLCH
jgi:transposase